VTADRTDGTWENYRVPHRRVLAANEQHQGRLPRRPAAVVFDMDGLLFNTEALYHEALLLAAAEHGRDVASDLFGQTVGLPWPQTRAVLLAHFGEDFAVDELAATWLRHFWLIAETRLEMKEGVLELLDALDRLQLPRGIATSSSRQTVERHLTMHDLAGRFDAIVGRGDYEGGKPAPDPFLTAAKRLEVEPQLCLALEDSPNGVRSASAAGMMTVMVPDLVAPTDDILALCTFLARDLHEVRQLILKSTSEHRPID
jgi:beta-phosphoglucomutase-like phosphatase (HAD superfamily)